MNEKGCQVQAPIGYEWKSTKCEKCKKYGHHETSCYYSRDAPKTKKVWKTKDQIQVRENRETTLSNHEEDPHKIIQDGPWMIMGDLNCVLQMEERCCSNVRMQEINPGRMCMERCGLIDIPYGGISDHCPALVRSINDDSEGKKPIKYYKMWREAEGNTEKVRMAWEGKDQGTSMYKITRKLKRVKNSLKELNRIGFFTIQADAHKAYQQLILAQ
ncbi:tRNA(fMet)-specific endonuclease VapC [Bienertia sinuspersici]